MASDNLHANPYKVAGIIQKLMDAENPPMKEATVTGRRMRKPITVKGTARARGVEQVFKEVQRSAASKSPTSRVTVGNSYSSR